MTGDYYTIDRADAVKTKPRYHSHDAPMPLAGGEPVREYYARDLVDPLAHLTRTLDAICSKDNRRRRQASRDNRSIPAAPVYYPNPRARRVDIEHTIAEGAAAAREQAYGEQARLGDLQRQLDDFWDREIEKRRR
jgi:hypothetical protein